MPKILCTLLQDRDGRVIMSKTRAITVNTIPILAQGQGVDYSIGSKGIFEGRGCIDQGESLADNHWQVLKYH